jgi:Holliday junction resolvase RusA-like endonuclease
MTAEQAAGLGIVLTVPGDPSGARINQARRATIVRKKGKNTPGTRPSTKAQSWADMAKLELRSQWRQVSCEPLSGPVTLEVRTHWHRLRRKGPAKGQPLGDVDATCKAVLDALQEAGVLYNDAQVYRVTLVNIYDRENPRIEVLL